MLAGAGRGSLLLRAAVRRRSAAAAASSFSSSSSSSSGGRAGSSLGAAAAAASTSSFSSSSSSSHRQTGVERRTAPTAATGGLFSRGKSSSTHQHQQQSHGSPPPPPPMGGASPAGMEEDIAYRTAPAGSGMEHTLPDVIMPRWIDPVASQSNPLLANSRFELDCLGAVSEADLAGETDLGARIKAVFDQEGMVHVRNTGLTDLAEMRRLALHGLGGELDYKGGSNPRNSLGGEEAPSVFEVGAPLTAHLHYHHEMAYLGNSTKALAFLCKDTVPKRGATYFSDSVQVTDHILQTELGRKLKEKGVCYHRKMTDREKFKGELEVGVYNHWQLSMHTDDPVEAEATAKSMGLHVSWGPDRRMDTRYYQAAFEYFPLMDRNMLYCSIADHGMWFDGWPLVMHLPYEERPLYMTYGDDTEFTRAELEEFVEAYDKFGIEIDWKPGDMVVFCNYRMAHGRPGIHLNPGEKRALGVMLGERYDRLGQYDDKW